MARRSVSMPRAGPRGSGKLFLTHPELLSPGAEDVASCCSPSLRRLPSSTNDTLCCMCVLLCRGECVSVFLKECVNILLSSACSFLKRVLGSLFVFVHLGQFLIIMFHNQYLTKNAHQGCIYMNNNTVKTVTL